LFPGGEEDGRRWSLCNGGDQGLDCVLFQIFRVLCAYFWDWIVISFSSGVLSVIWSVCAFG
jgi:hypothetical protein